MSSSRAVLVDVTYFERIQSESSVINKFDSLPRYWQTYSKFMNIIGSSLTKLDYLFIFLFLSLIIIAFSH
jgi:hypothetical protein